MIIFSDSEFFLEENDNYPKGMGNLFLMKKNPLGFDRCLGGADLDKRQGVWEATVTCTYDPVTDSDAELLGTYETQLEAAKALWQVRYSFW